jgi:ABC-type branched-subunit amino acid transport system ATPase component
VSLEVRAGEVTALLGRNGAGKSSTLKTIMGLVAPASGTITCEGAPITGHTPESIARAGIGLVPQGRRLFAGLTVAENLRLGALARTGGSGVRWDDERIFAYFPRIRDKLGTRADALSGGEQQMVAIARALSGNVKLLMLDEPFEGLAPAVVEEVFKSLDQLRREIAFIIGMPRSRAGPCRSRLRARPRPRVARGPGRTAIERSRVPKEGPMAMNTSAKDLRVLVTAGAAGIGRAIATTFVEHGARVCTSATSTATRSKM